MSPISEFDDNIADETIEDDLTAYSVDDETQLQPDDSLVGPGSGDEDVLDAGLVANDRPVGTDSWGTTALEQEVGETIDMRLQQELPDDGGAYGRPTDHVREADADPDDVPADGDFSGDAAPRAGRLVAPDEGAREDTEAGAVGSDVGVDGGAASAEEAAVHVVTEDDLDGNGVDDLAQDLAAEERELAAEATELGIGADDVADLDERDDA